MLLEKVIFLKTLGVASVLLTGFIFLLGLQTNDVYAFPKEILKGNYTFGIINSIQNDEEGNPAWIVSGHWKSNLLNDTQTGPENKHSIFDTSFKMIKFDGTAKHTHTITNFTLNESSNPTNMTTVINGTATMSMEDDLITDIPTAITFANDKVVSIWLDPSSINNHLGNTPLYGLIKSDDYKSKKYPGK